MNGEIAAWWNRAASAVKAWWHRSGWRTIAAVAVPLAIVFGLVAAIQRVELQDHHLEVAWGNVAEWLSGVATVAAFGALLVGALEWRSGQAERRDREAEQARLIIAVRDKRESSYDLVIRNRSELPVFNVKFHERESLGMMGWQQIRPRSVLEAGEATDPVRVGHDITVRDVDYVTFSFTDGRGRRWRRTGNGPPERRA